MGFDTGDVETKTLSIMKVLSESDGPLGARTIAQHLKDYGIELGDRAVGYHLKLMDERGLTELVGRRDGRVLTAAGFKEVKSALVTGKVGFIVPKIELLSFRTTFDPDSRSGDVPVNVSFFAKREFSQALRAMKSVFRSEFCVSDLVAAASEGERLGELGVPAGKVGLATVCSIIVNGSLLKAGVPMDSRFAGILQVRNHRPLRFVELIYYAGSSLDPSEMFIKASMTSVRHAVELGDGEILANFREIPAQCGPTVEQVVGRLKEAGLGRAIAIGNTSEAVCKIPVELGRVGMVLLGGLNPVAAAREAGIEADNHAMSTVMDYQELVRFEEL